MEPESRSGEEAPDEVSHGRSVRAIVSDVVAEVAPEELVVVEGLRQFDDDTVVRRLASTAQREDPLGFGVADLVPLVTPVVWLVLDEAAKRAASSAVDGAARGGKALLRKIFRRRATPVTVPALTQEQLAEVRRQILESAASRGLSQERATAVADAVVSRLALAKPDRDDQSPRGDAGG